jgi:4-hydroxy-3-methylbut-2-en-1-yl diphosphate synthase IspG/GcpE
LRDWLSRAALGLALGATRSGEDVYGVVASGVFVAGVLADALEDDT